MKIVKKATVAALYAVMLAWMAIVVHAFFACGDVEYRTKVIREWAVANPAAVQAAENGDRHAICRTFLKTPVLTTRLAAAMAWL